MSPTTQAAPAMSPFMSSMPAAGLIEMPPVSKQTPLPMKVTGAAPRLPPFQRMTTARLSCCEPWPTPSSAFMPSFFIPLRSSTSTATPSFFRFPQRAGELLRVQHVGRLVDEIAREQHAACHPGLLCKRLFHCRHRRDRNRDLDLRRFFLVVLAFGLVALERIAPQLQAHSDVGGCIRLERSARKVGDDGRRLRR